MNEVLNYLNNLLVNDDTIIIGCSSGPDSMVLLHLLQNLNLNLKIVCAHVNHNVRKQSKEEYQFLEKYCRNNNIIFEGLSLNFETLQNFESEARKKRYEFYEMLFLKYDAKYILTAHHGDDQIETILMRITRGSTLNGYAGIKLQEGKYIRPLLFITKDTILKYLEKHNLKYFIDETNFSLNHTRNRYRHYVLPFLKKENENVHLKYLKFSNELNEYDYFVTNYINKNNLIQNNKIEVNKVLTESEFIQRKTIELLIKNIQKNFLFDVSDKNIKDVLNLVKSQKSSLLVDLKNGFIARKYAGFLEITKKENQINFEKKFIDSYNDNFFCIKQIKKSDKVSNYIIRLSKDEIKMPLYIRNVKPGDKIKVKNLGTKKISDIFINEKINPEKRKNYPILVDSDGVVLWLPGIKKSKFDKDKKEKYDIILLCERKD